MSTPKRRIAHLDMDAFFASVELLRYPQLKGLPVVIGGGRREADDQLLTRFAGRPPSEIPPGFFPRLSSYQGRGVITTATYAARQFGVGSAMGIMKAARLCPDAILLPVDFEEVYRYSQRFKGIIRSYAPIVEDVGVDEVYADLTRVPGADEGGGELLARNIQASIFEATGLTCSIAVAPNKLLAKMGSEFDKPNGITILHDADLEPRIWPLAVAKINGIGPKTNARLAKLGILTIGDLAAKKLPWLVDEFGQSTGTWMHHASWGRDWRPVVTHSEPVSMSRETTFERDLDAKADRAELGELFTSLCHRVSHDLRESGYVGRSVSIKLRYQDFHTVTRDITLDHFTDDARMIRLAASQCLKRVSLSQRLRLLGVRVGKLVRVDSPEARGLGQTMDLFADRC